MINRFYVDHRLPFKTWAKIQLKSLSQSLGSVTVRPIESNIRSCFVVGCGHSGTTLMAARIGSAKECFPIARETGLFMPDRGLHATTTALRELLYVAEAAGKEMLVEKTPKHIHAIDNIRKVLPEARIVLMTRNPLDNCASLYKRFGNLDYCIERWCLDNREAVKAKSHGSFVHHVRFEDLTERPEQTLQSVYRFLDLTWEADILDAGQTAYDKLSGSGNIVVRREQVAKPITLNRDSWKKVFTEEQRDLVTSRTRELASELGY